MLGLLNRRNIGIATVLFLLITIAGVRHGVCDQNTTAGASDSNPALERTLQKVNDWRRSHTNGVFTFKVTLGFGNIIVTNCYIGNDFKVLFQSLNTCVEFLSSDGDALIYFPSTGVTVKDPNPANTYVLKELSFCQELTVAKLEHGGAKLKYARKGNLDCLLISIPDAPSSQSKTQDPVKYVGTHKMLIDADGKIVGQVMTINGYPPVSTDIEYVTFDLEKVKAIYDSIAVKAVVDNGVKLKDAILAEDAKNKNLSTKMLTSKNFLIWFFVVSTLIVPVGVLVMSRKGSKPD